MDMALCGLVLYVVIAHWALLRRLEKLEDRVRYTLPSESDAETTPWPRH